MRALLLPCLLLGLAAPSFAAESPPAQGNAVTARLIAVEDGVAPGAATLSAGLALSLADGWHTYWRSPGEVGLPPALDWSASDNVASVELAYPAPERFEAFGIQNFGYSDGVTFPLAVALERPGEPARLDVTAELLVCAEICVPETLRVTLDLPRGGGIDAGAAAAMAEWIARVPGAGDAAGIALGAVHLDGEALTFEARSATPFGAVDVFPEHGSAAFGLPEIMLSDGGRALWARVPVLAAGEGPLDLTLVDGARAVTIGAEPGDVAPVPPAAGRGLWAMLAVAALGGLILNAMPCVLPVLSLKLASALGARDRPVARVRAGFAASAAGAVAFFLALAGLAIALRAGGVAVGWGMQFQQPAFLAAMVMLVTLFAANLLGLFEVSLGQGAMTGMARAEARGGLGGDFATGAFAALMATPCSAPFVGTAVAFALTRGPVETVAVFGAMGLGLASPYLVVAARPGLVARLPRPGRWMVWIKGALGLLLVGTAIWLVTVLAGSAGWRVAGIVGGLAAALLAALAAWRRPAALGAAGLALALSAALLVPAAPAAERSAAGWTRFEPGRIADEVAAGRVVFVDVTADWCLTCLANKRLVLDRAPVAEALAGTVAMRADWTRPDEAIAAWLRGHGRFGIPFDAVYGPGAPEGIVLPELLTERAVLDALAAAGG